MKDSGIPWIGAIPKTWAVIRTKNVFECSKELVGEDWKNTQLLSLSTKGIKAVEIGSTSGKVPDTYETYQKVAKDKIVMCLFDLDCSAVFSGLSPICGMISPAYKVLNVLDGYYPKFYSYWFDYIFDGRKYKYLSKNIRYSLTYDEFAALGIAAPPFEEQQRIADFLDQKCSEVDEMVALQEQIIEELKAYKQAIITEAVCKGLNPDAEMKYSGVEWLGKIPREWKMPKLGLITSKIGSGSTPRGGSETYSSSGIKFIRSQNVYNEGFRLDDVVYITEEIHNEMSGTHVCKGDILFNITGGSIGRCHFVEEGFGEANVNQHVSIVRPLPIVDTVFLMYALQSDYGQFQVQLQQTGGNREGLSANGFKEFVIALPPLSEQQQIAEFLDQKCADIDSLVAIKQQKIEELKEYKKSIIYEYITGKKEVAK
jgi:type I restriction enzyme S subunit